MLRVVQLIRFVVRLIVVKRVIVWFILIEQQQLVRQFVRFIWQWVVQQ